MTVGREAGPGRVIQPVLCQQCGDREAVLGHVLCALCIDQTYVDLQAASAPIAPVLPDA